MNKFYRIFAIFLLLIDVFHFVFGDEKKQAEEKTLFIEGGSIYTVTKGIIHGGCILVKKGKIEKVGKNLIPPQDALVLKAENKWIMPGFVVVHAYPIGIHPLIEEDKNPEIINYLDPFSLEFRLCLASGITTLSPNLTPSYQKKRKNYSIFNAVIKPAYGCLEEILVKEPAYLYIDMPELTASEKEELRVLFQRAREFLSRKMEYEEKKELKKAKAPEMPPDLKHYVTALKRELPVRFNADKKKDILKVLAFVDEFEVLAQILGASEGWLVADEIGRRNISTILQPEKFLSPDPYPYPPNGSNIKNSLLQKEKGVRFAIINTYPSLSTTGMLGNDLLTFPLAGSYAIRGGLEEKDALEAITIRPAELLGMSHQIGSLEEGKDADIIILDGNPFDYRTYVEFTILNGKLLYDKSKSSFFKNVPKPKRMF